MTATWVVKWLLRLTSLLLHLGIERVKGVEPGCRALHGASPGLDLVCCSRDNPIVSPHCQYSRPQYCGPDACSCLVKIRSDQFNCSLSGNHSFQWLDHSDLDGDFPCSRPDFPNPNATFTLNILVHSASPIGLHLESLLGALVEYEVVEARVVVQGGASLPQTFFRGLPGLRAVSVVGEGEGGGLTSFPSSLTHLASLSVLNLRHLPTLQSIGNDGKAALTSSLSRFYILDSPNLRALPPWLLKANLLEVVKIEETGLAELGGFPKSLPGLEILNLDGNRLEVFDGEAREYPSLRILDLSRNRIRVLTGFKSGGFDRLELLDLSSNPLSELPSRIFSNLLRLRTLKLDDCRIKFISAETFLGLGALRHLSLRGNGGVVVAPFSFLSLGSLESLDMRSCNLSVLPEATTQACGIRSLWFGQNRFHRDHALPPEVLLQLTGVKRLELVGNPLAMNPRALFLLPPTSRGLMESLVGSLRQLPFWWNDPCAFYVWRHHLCLSPLLPLPLRKTYRKLFPATPAKKMRKRKKQNCLRDYRLVMESLEPYKELSLNVRCESVRRLRSLEPEVPSTPSPSPTPLSPIPVVLEEGEDCQHLRFLSTLSVLVNAVSVTALLLLCTLRAAKRSNWCRGS